MVVPRRECTASGRVSPPGIANPPTAHTAIGRPRRCSAAPLGVEPRPGSFLSYGQPTSCSAAAPGQVAVALLRVYRYRFLAERSACRLALDHRGLSERHPVDPSRRRLSPDRQLQRADHRPPDPRHPGEPDSRADHCVLPQAEHRALNTPAADTMIAFDSERLLRMLHPGTACDPVAHHEQLRESSRLTVLRTHSAVAPSHRCFGLGESVPRETSPRAEQLAPTADPHREPFRCPDLWRGSRVLMRLLTP